jgi:hypothetical protein
MADDYGSAHARGNAHIRLSGHPNIKYSQIEAPERIKGALMKAKASMEMMAVEAGVKDIAVGEMRSFTPNGVGPTSQGAVGACLNWP